MRAANNRCPCATRVQLARRPQLRVRAAALPAARRRFSGSAPIPASASAAANSARAIVVRDATRTRTCAPPRKLLAARSNIVRSLSAPPHPYIHTHRRIALSDHSRRAADCDGRLASRLSAAPQFLHRSGRRLASSAAPRKARAFSTWARAFHGASIAINNSRLIRDVAREPFACATRVSVSISVLPVASLCLPAARLT